MSKQSLLRAVAAGMLLLSATAGYAADAGRQRVVMQVSDDSPKVWNLTLNNAKNVKQELGKDNVDVEIVAYGPGLKMLLMDSEVRNRLKEAHGMGVELRACGNTMKAQKVSDKDLAEDVKVVPAGVVEIMTKQREGWAYIKP